MNMNKRCTRNRTKTTAVMMTLAALVSVSLSEMARAGTTGTEFQTLHTMVTGWASGYLGKSIAVASFLLGAGTGLVKSSLMPAIVGVGFAGLFAVGPGIVDSLITATI